MKSKLLLFLCIVSFILVSGCASESIPEPTALPEPSDTPKPTVAPTEITYNDEKAEIAVEIQSLTNVKGTNISCETVTWEGDLLKIKCELVDWAIEPSEDHHFLQYWILDEAIPMALQDADDWEKYFSDNTIIEIVTAGSTMEQLSKTNFSTFQKITDGSITTEVEWLSEADVIMN